MAHLKGWQGVWEPAKVTEKDQDGHRRLQGSRSIYRLGKKETLHMFSSYGFDIGQKDQQGQNYYARGNRPITYRLGRLITQLGRVPWIIGGDWNMTP
eukprot:6002887-Heterocapsa_arctica.AAC.2